MRDSLRFSRRSLALGSLAALATSVVAAGGGGSKRRFLVVNVEGGWDPLCAFAPLFGKTGIDIEKDCALKTVGNFALVDSPKRPAVTKFFQTWGKKTLLINGLSTRSVNHEVCQTIALTGSTSDNAADWATLLAVSDEKSYHLPHVVLAGPSFPGAHTVVVSRAEGRVQDAVHGTILANSDAALTAPSDAGRALVDEYLDLRTTAIAAEAPALALHAQYRAAFKRARGLVDAKELVDFPPVSSFADLSKNAIALLANSVARCVTISSGSGFSWDTHNDNSLQSQLWQDLFTDLDAIMASLEKATLSDGTQLAKETVVVVISEMGRTPSLNGTGGRDHWPYTSALVIGPGITGDRTIGGYTDLYAGVGVDPKSGEKQTSRPGIDAKSLGATLLALGDVDPGAFMKSPEVITGVLT
jgi:uncharacterized protein (DUF1501 family)